LFILPVFLWLCLFILLPAGMIFSIFAALYIMAEKNFIYRNPVESNELLWYACITRPRSEKLAFSRLSEVGIESYLPLQKSRRRWSDRIKWVDIPLFRSYVFVRVNHDLSRQVLVTEGIVRYVAFGERPVPIPDRQIEAVKLLLGQGVDLEVTSENFTPGAAIEVIAGPLIGLKGELVQVRGSKKVLIRVGDIGQGLLVTIEPGMLSRI